MSYSIGHTIHQTSSTGSFHSTRTPAFPKPTHAFCQLMRCARKSGASACARLWPDVACTASTVGASSSDETMRTRRARAAIACDAKEGGTADVAEHNSSNLDYQTATFQTGVAWPTCPRSTPCWPRCPCRLGGRRRPSPAPASASSLSKWVGNEKNAAYSLQAPCCCCCSMGLKPLPHCLAQPCTHRAH